MIRLTTMIAASSLAITSATAFAQSPDESGKSAAPSASTVGAGSSSGGSATVGTAGSGAAGGTSASTIGLGGTSTGPAGTSATIGGGGSAATSEGGKATTSNKIQENPNKLQDKARAKAQDGGTWSKSQTKTTITDEGATSRTRTMAHEPGGPPAKSTTTRSVPTSR